MGHNIIRSLYTVLAALLLLLLVFGCADISVSANTVTKRHGDTTMVTCLASGQTDVLTCFNDRWMGELANCSKGRTILAHIISSSCWIVAVAYAHQPTHPTDCLPPSMSCPRGLGRHTATVINQPTAYSHCRCILTIFLTSCYLRHFFTIES